MKILLTVLFVFIFLALIVLFIGLILPAERIGTSEAIYKASPKEVYNVVTNNDDYQYRTDLKELKIIKRDGDFEIWDEISTGGTVIRFKTARKEPYSRYDIQMITKVFTGYWISTFQETDDGGTRFVTTEKITIRNPFLRVINRLIFNLDKFMSTYQDDVRKKLEEN